MRLRLRFVVADFAGHIPIDQSQVIYFVPPSFERIQDVSSDVCKRWALPAETVVQLYLCVAGAAEYLLPVSETILALNDLDEIVVRRRGTEAVVTVLPSTTIQAVPTQAHGIPAVVLPQTAVGVLPSVPAPDRKRKQGMFSRFVWTFGATHNCGVFETCGLHDSSYPLFQK